MSYRMAMDSAAHQMPMKSMKDRKLSQYEKVDLIRQ